MAAPQTVPPALLPPRFMDVSESYRQVQVDLTHAADRAALQRRAYCLAWEHARRTLLARGRHGGVCR